MAITLGSVELSDVEVTDGIGRGDVAAAARLWVRHWPTALDAAREYVAPEEVPGLAAEALIGTIAAIAVGRGPRENLTAFVTSAVAELAEGEEPPSSSTGEVPPPVFVSRLMTSAFEALPASDQDVLRLTATGELTDQETATALDLPLAMAVDARRGSLTALQRDYLAVHTEEAEPGPCDGAHAELAAAVHRSAPLDGATWVHLSECAWCTEAFHELAFSSIALDALVDPAVFAATDAGLETAVIPAVAIPGLHESAPATAPATGPETGPASGAASEPDDALLAPAAGVADPTDPADLSTDPAEQPNRRRRGALIAAGAVAASAVLVVAVLAATGTEAPDAPLTAAQTEETQSADLLPDSFDSVAPPVLEDEDPTPTLTPGTPSTPPSPAPSASPAAPAAPPTTTAATPQAPATTAAPKPTPKPSPTTSAPKPTPDPEPTTSPTPTPTEPACTGWERLFGLC